MNVERLMSFICTPVARHNSECKKALSIYNAKLGIVKEPFELILIEQFYAEHMDGVNAEVEKDDLVIIISCDHCSFIDFVSIPF